MGAGLIALLALASAAAWFAGGLSPVAGGEGSTAASTGVEVEGLVGDPGRPDEGRAFGGCYDLSALASVPGAPGACLGGPDTLLPASSLTGHMVDLFLGGAEVRIRRDEDGRRTVTLKGFESPDELLFLDPPATSRMPPPNRVASVRSPRPPRRPDPPPQDPGTAPLASALPAAAPPPVVAQVVEDLDLPPPGASLQLPVPRAVEGPSTLTEGSPSLERMLEGMSRSASRMECGPEGCTCAHPPCVPCPLSTNRLRGVDEDTWAVGWIVWYATEATTSERFLGVRSLTSEEADLIRRSKYRWGFAGSLGEAIGRWDWDRGRIPAGLVTGAGGHLRALQAQGARLIGAEPPPAGDLQGAVAIVTDGTAPAAARIHALRWLGERGRDPSVRNVLRDLAARDPDESIRSVAMDALDALAGRASGRSPKDDFRNPVSVESR